MVVSHTDRRGMNSEENHKQKVSERRKFNSLQDGYVGFLKILDFDPKNVKNEENCCRLRNFQS